MSRRLRALTAVVVLAPALALSAPPEMCIPGGTAPALVLRAESVLEAPGMDPVWQAAGGEPVALACRPDTAVVALAEGSRGRIVWLERVDEQWRSAGESELRAVPRQVRLTEGLAIVLTDSRRDEQIVVLEGPRLRPVVRGLVGPPACLAVIEDEGLALVGLGSRIATYRLPRASTWVVWEFDEEVTACSASPEARGLLVGLGSRVILVDPDDRATRGRLPVRAARRFETPVREVVWTGAGEIAAVRLASPDRVVFLRGSDLEALAAIELSDAASAVVPVAAGWIAWAESSGALAEYRIPDEALAKARPLPRSTAATSSAVPGPETRAVPEVPAAAPNSAEKREERKDSEPLPPAPEPPATGEPAVAMPAGPSISSPGRSAAPDALETPAPAESGKPGSRSAERAVVKEAGDTPSTSASEEREPSSPGRSTERVPEPAPPAESAPAEQESSGAEPSAVRAPAAVPPVESATARPEPSVAEKRVAEKERETGAASAKREADTTSDSPGPAGVETPIPSVAPASGIVGRLTGRVDLVHEVALLGPDSILAEFRRITPSVRGDEAGFLAEDLPPGSYRVIPMGLGGTTLLSRPAFASVQVSNESGASVEFEVVRTLP